MSSMPDAALADDDAGLAGVDDHAHLVGAPLDLDFARSPPSATCRPKYLRIATSSCSHARVLLVLEPAGVPRARDAEPQADRMNLLTHV